MIAMLAAFKQKETGIIIENKALGNQTHQLSIKVDDLQRIPNAQDSYLIAIKNLSLLKNNYQSFNITKTPDENNLLTFTVHQTDDLATIEPGHKVKLRGIF